MSHEPPVYASAQPMMSPPCMYSYLRGFKNHLLRRGTRMPANKIEEVVPKHFFPPRHVAGGGGSKNIPFTPTSPLFSRRRPWQRAGVEHTLALASNHSKARRRLWFHRRRSRETHQRSSAEGERPPRNQRSYTSRADQSAARGENNAHVVILELAVGRRGEAADAPSHSAGGAVLDQDERRLLADDGLVDCKPEGGGAVPAAAASISFVFERRPRVPSHEGGRGAVPPPSGADAVARRAVEAPLRAPSSRCARGCGLLGWRRWVHSQRNRAQEASAGEASDLLRCVPRQLEWPVPSIGEGAWRICGKDEHSVQQCIRLQINYWL